jgi:hypothetical protein
MRRTWLATLVLVTFTAPLVAQQSPPSHVYFSYSKVNFADWAQWMADLAEHHTPVLDELRDDGTIHGWSAWVHHTGSEYNVMLSIRTTGWDAIDTFWGEYLGRLGERAPEAFARAMAMTEAHYDEIWTVNEPHHVPGAAENYAYDSRFQLGFDAIPAWNAYWAEHVAPALQEAMDDGLLSGWVTLGHNSGGRFNWQVRYWFAEWQDIETFTSRLEAAMFADPDAFASAARSIQAHEDELWRTVPDQEDN